MLRHNDRGFRFGNLLAHGRRHELLVELVQFVLPFVVETFACANSVVHLGGIAFDPLEEFLHLEDQLPGGKGLIFALHERKRLDLAAPIDEEHVRLFGAEEVFERHGVRAASSPATRSSRACSPRRIAQVPCCGARNPAAPWHVRVQLRAGPLRVVFVAAAARPSCPAPRPCAKKARLGGTDAVRGEACRSVSEIRAERRKCLTPPRGMPSIPVAVGGSPRR